MMALGGSSSRPGLTWLVRMATGHHTFTHFLSGERSDPQRVRLMRRAAAVPRRDSAASDYWFLLGSRAPDAGRGITRATVAHTWKDYFRINTDHKVIGIQLHRDLVSSSFSSAA